MIENIRLGTGGGEFDAYVCRPRPVEQPAGTVGTIGGIILVHEVWGLVEHIKEVADRLCHLGYLVVAPDLLAASGAAPAGNVDELQQAMFDPDPAVRNRAQPRLRELFGPLHAPDFSARALRDLRACYDWLDGQPGVDGRIGIVGFCFGGTQAFSFAAAEPRLRAAVPFYGQAALDEAALRGIRCPVLAFYGERDTRLVDQLPRLQRDMAAAGVDFRPHVLPDCGHAFFNDSNPYAYDADAATRSWAMTVDFLSGSFSS